MAPRANGNNLHTGSGFCAKRSSDDVQSSLPKAPPADSAASMRSQRRIRSRAAGVAGASLAELLMGILITMIALVPGLRVIMSETTIVSGTREHSQAAAIAQRVIESGRSYPFEHLDRFAAEYRDKVVRRQDIDYVITDVSVQPILTTDPPGRLCAKKLSFAVRYQNAEKRTLRLELATVIARHN